MIAGTTEVMHLKGGVGAEWYCNSHKKYIKPIWIENPRQDERRPACLDCLTEELGDDDLIDAERINTQPCGTALLLPAPIQDLQSRMIDAMQERYGFETDELDESSERILHRDY